MAGFTLKLIIPEGVSQKQWATQWVGYFYLNEWSGYMSDFLPIDRVWEETRLEGKQTGLMVVTLYDKNYGQNESRNIGEVTLEAGKDYIVNYVTKEVKEIVPSPVDGKDKTKILVLPLILVALAVGVVILKKGRVP